MVVAVVVVGVAVAVVLVVVVVQVVVLLVLLLLLLLSCCVAVVSKGSGSSADLRAKDKELDLVSKANELTESDTNEPSTVLLLVLQSYSPFPAQRINKQDSVPQSLEMPSGLLTEQNSEPCSSPCCRRDGCWACRRWLGLATVCSRSIEVRIFEAYPRCLDLLGWRPWELELHVGPVSKERSFRNSRNN